MYFRTLIVASFAVFFICGSKASAQTLDKAYFEKHLATKAYAIDTEASAVILFDKRDIVLSTENVGPTQFRFIQSETVHRIVKILKADALVGSENEANVHIRYYTSKGRNYVSELKGTTYNLLGKEMQETKIGSTDHYEKEINKYYSEVSFSFPNAKPGSVIEYSYNLVTDMSDQMPQWDVQEDIPKLVSEYSILSPLAYEYTSLLHVRAAKKKFPQLADALRDSAEFCSVEWKDNYHTMITYVRKNIPALKEEPYVTTPDNYQENVEFQLTGYRSAIYSKEFNNTWDKVNDEQYKQYIGIMNKGNGKLDEIADSIALVDTSLQGKRVNIYNYVRAHFNYLEEGYKPSSNVLASVYKNKSGNAAEINTVLLYMYFRDAVPAYPLFLATIGNRSPSPVFPVNRFNYMACAAKQDSGFVYLDAANKNNNYGSLPGYCYNGYARVVDSTGQGVELTSDLIKDKSVVGITISGITDSSAHIEIMKKNGMITSASLRKKWAKDDTDKQAYTDKFIQELPANFEIKDNSITNLENPDANIIEKYTGVMTFKKGTNTLFINSTLMKLFNKNPFTAAKRTLPVDFPHQTDYQCFMNITLPADMEAVDIPEPAILDFENGGMMHKKIYNYNSALHLLTVSSNFTIATTRYDPADYTEMKDFFQKTIESDNEIVTLKKTKAK